MAGLVAAGAIGAALTAAPAGLIDDPEEIASGHEIYRQQCAACHGTKLEGQPHWWEVGANGKLPAPPLDQGGHTTQHSDAELHELVSNSVYNLAAPGYQSDMPAFGATLSAAEIHAVIVFVKNSWPPGVRAYQAALNPGGSSLAGLTGDWTFPPSCNLHFGPKPP